MSKKERKALGRGFSALLKPLEDPVRKESDEIVSQLLIEDIIKNPKQPRSEINSDKLEELAQSIKIKGVLQPILVRKKQGHGKNYELIAGERRLRASKLAGFDRVPAIIKQIKERWRYYVWNSKN